MTHDFVQIRASFSSGLLLYQHGHETGLAAETKPPRSDRYVNSNFFTNIGELFVYFRLYREGTRQGRRLRPGPRSNSFVVPSITNIYMSLSTGFIVHKRMLDLQPAKVSLKKIRCAAAVYKGCGANMRAVAGFLVERFGRACGKPLPAEHTPPPSRLSRLASSATLFDVSPSANITASDAHHAQHIPRRRWRSVPARNGLRVICELTAFATLKMSAPGLDSASYLENPPGA